MIVRLADSFGWDVPDWERLQQRAPAMLEGGYVLTRDPRALAGGRTDRGNEVRRDPT